MTNLFTRDGSLFTGRASKNERGLVGYYPGERECHRCGGQGWAQKWQFTGLTCFECGGAGKVPSERFIRLFEADQLVKLNAAAAKREATRQRKSDERAAAEAARRAAELADCIKRNAEILSLMRPYVERSAFIAELEERIAVKALDLTPAQDEAVRRSIAAMRAEDDRRNRARHIGTIGERVELELEFQRLIDLTRPYEPPFMIWVFRAPDGSSVIYKGGDPVAFDGLPTEIIGEGRDAYRSHVKGGKIKLIVTIKDHGENRKTGEPETIIARPAVPKAKAKEGEKV